MTDVVQPRSRLRDGRLTIAGLLGRFGFYLAMLILILVFATLSSAFLTLANGINILQQTSTIGIITLGETLVILAGGIDVSVGSVLLRNMSSICLLMAVMFFASLTLTQNMPT